MDTLNMDSQKDRRAKNLAKMKDYNIKNREKIKLRRKIFYEKNKERILAERKTDRNKEVNRNHKKKAYYKNRELLLCKRKIYLKNNQEKVKKWKKTDYLKNREKYSNRAKKRYLNKKSIILAKNKERYEKNKERYNESQRIRMQTAEHKQNRLKWLKENRAIENARGSKYRANKKKATPKWLTKEDFNKIKQLFVLAKQMEELDGIERHVDHIIPLNGKIVSGLHVPWNLQILTKTENLKKNNSIKGIYERHS